MFYKHRDVFVIIKFKDNNDNTTYMYELYLLIETK